MPSTTEHNYFYNQVAKFHTAFGHTIHTKPTPMPAETAVKRAIWSGEELIEFLHETAQNETEFLALVDQFKAGIDTAVEKSRQDAYPLTDHERIVGQADALVDELYFNQGSFTVLGVKPTPLFDIVQSANMAKLGPDGKPIIRKSDNKIMKPNGWEAPEPKLSAEIRNQLDK